MAPPLNVLPVDHTREDYDFDYADGRGPIRHLGIDPTPPYYPEQPYVWCIRHTRWEPEETH